MNPIEQYKLGPAEELQKVSTGKDILYGLRRQRRPSYHRATPWVFGRFFFDFAGQRPASLTPATSLAIWVPRQNESRFERSDQSWTYKPRALPWAGITQAIGLNGMGAINDMGSVTRSSEGSNNNSGFSFRFETRLVPQGGPNGFGQRLATRW